jgi:hypothetical protein
MSLTVGTLADGRIQVWNDLACKTKVSTQPGAAWSDWINHPLGKEYSFVSLPCAIQGADGDVGVYCNATVSSQATSGSLAHSVPTILGLVEYPEGSEQDWQPWTIGPAGSVVLAGAVLGGQLSASLTPGYNGARAPILIWYQPPAGALGVLPTNTAGESGPMAPFIPTPPTTLLWPLYGANSSDPSQNQALFAGTPINYGLWGQPQPYLKLYITTGTIDYSFGGHQQPFDWAPWREFSPALEQSTGGVASLAASVLPGGAIQIFASDTSGQLWTIWQESRENSFVWINSWQTFPLPGGNRLSKLYIGNSDAAPPSLEQASLALAQTVTGELQLFAKDENVTVWTTWKTSAIPGAGWSVWEKF